MMHMEWTKDNPEKWYCGCRTYTEAGVFVHVPCIPNRNCQVSRILAAERRRLARTPRLAVGA